MFGTKRCGGNFVRNRQKHSDSHSQVFRCAFTVTDCVTQLLPDVVTAADEGQWRTATSSTTATTATLTRLLTTEHAAGEDGSDLSYSVNIRKGATIFGPLDKAKLASSEALTIVL